MKAWWRGFETGAALRQWLSTGVAALIVYEIIRTLFQGIRLAALLALGCALWYMIAPDAAATRLTMLWRALH